MKIDILTLFPEMFQGPFNESIIKRAQEKGLVSIQINNLRKWAKDRHKTVDDRPFGGGVGMVIMIQPIFDALESLKLKTKVKKLKVKEKIILLSPKGKVFNQKIARRLSKIDHLIFICGHYEGIDERVSEHLIDEEISIGDYILTGGELPTMVIVDAVARLIPGVLEKTEATKTESFQQLTINNLPAGRQGQQSTILEYPQYTRPANFKSWNVPEVLLSGDHKKIEKWRKNKSLEFTKERRPDLI